MILFKFYYPRISLNAFNRIRLRKLAKEFTWIILGQVVVVIGSLTLVRVLTELLTPAEYGKLALALTLVGLFGQVIFGGLGGGISRYYAVAAEKRDLHGFLAASFKLLCFATLVSIGVGLAIASGFALLSFSQWIGLALAATVLAILSGYNGSMNGVQNAARQRATVAMHRGLDAWLKIILAVSFILWLGKSSTAVILGFALSTFLVTLSQLVFLRKTILPRAPSYSKPVTYEWTQKIWVYSWPFSAWGIFSWMQQSSDRWALGLLSDTQDVGLYAVLFQLGYTPISLVLNMSLTLLGPILYQRAGDATCEMRNRHVHQLIWRTSTVALALTGLAVLFASALHDWLFGILVAKDFRGVSYLFPWLLLAGGMFATGQVLSLKSMSEMKSRVLIAPKIITALLGIGLNALGAVLAGLEGVVAALVAFSTIYLVWMILLAKSKGARNAKMESVEV